MTLVPGQSWKPRDQEITKALRKPTLRPGTSQSQGQGKWHRRPSYAKQAHARKKEHCFVKYLAQDLEGLWIPTGRRHLAEAMVGRKGAVGGWGVGRNAKCSTWDEASHAMEEFQLLFSSQVPGKSQRGQHTFPSPSTHPTAPSTKDSWGPPSLAGYDERYMPTILVLGRFREEDSKFEGLSTGRPWVNIMVISHCSYYYS